jgi:urease alpha subunit
MGIEFLEIAVGLALFGGIFLAVIFSYHRLEAGRGDAAESARRATRTVAKPSFFAESNPCGHAAADLVLLRVEHHLRQEVKAASEFADSPSAETLWRNWHPTVGAA